MFLWVLQHALTTEHLSKWCDKVLLKTIALPFLSDIAYQYGCILSTTPKSMPMPGVKSSDRSQVLSSRYHDVPILLQLAATARSIDKHM